MEDRARRRDAELVDLVGAVLAEREGDQALLDVEQAPDDALDLLEHRGAHLGLGEQPHLDEDLAVALAGSLEQPEDRVAVLVHRDAPRTEQGVAERLDSIGRGGEDDVAVEDGHTLGELAQLCLEHPRHPVAVDGREHLRQRGVGEVTHEDVARLRRHTRIVAR